MIAFDILYPNQYQLACPFTHNITTDVSTKNKTTKRQQKEQKSPLHKRKRGRKRADNKSSVK